MPNLRAQLRQCLQGRVCLMGLGNVDYGDDGFGVRLAEKVKAESGAELEEETGGVVCGAWCAVRGAWMEGGGRWWTVDSGPRPADRGRWPVDRGLFCIPAGTTPERFVGRAAQEGFDHLIFVDAVDFGGAPGSVILLDSGQMNSRFPQISTHKISLGLLAKWVEANGTTRAWLLGVQPESLKPGEELTPALQATLTLLQQLLTESSMEVSL